ncbi:hypothetical protein B0H14DRAFT_2690791 [Mycena olivaceomarginata]|nr:hypothetical protein B0H14DRAFT_2690791 [Mycena olivaceomarginata]
MKSFQNIVASALVLSAFSLVNAAAVTSSAVGTPVAVTSTATRIHPSGSAATTAVSSSHITTPVASFSTVTAVSASTSAAVTSFPSGSVGPAGGFVVTGIYTTCLTVTFDAPRYNHLRSASASIGLPTVVAPSSTPVAVSSSAEATSPVSSTPVAVTSSVEATSPVTSTVVASGSASASSAPASVVVFTTCLAFLPSASATATATPSSSFFTFPTSDAVTSTIA